MVSIPPRQPKLFRPLMLTRDNQAGAVTPGYEGRIWAPVVTGPELWWVEKTRDKVIDLLTGVGDLQWRDYHHQHLQHLERSYAHAEGEYVLIASQGMIGWQTSDVNRIVQPAFAFRLYEAGVVLAHAFQASPPRGGDMRFPIRPFQGSAIRHLQLNPAIDHRDEMCIRRQIEHLARPWTVDTTEKNIAV